MNRLLELNIGDESEVVTRILVDVHQAIDANFEHAAAPPRRFTKTTFSDQLEDTNLNQLPGYEQQPENDVAVTKEKMVRLDQSPPEKTDEPRPLAAAAKGHEQQDGLFFSHLTSVVPNADTGPNQNLHPDQYTDLQRIGRPKSKYLKILVLILLVMTLIGLAALWLATNLKLPDAYQ